MFERVSSDKWIQMDHKEMNRLIQWMEKELEISNLAQWYRISDAQISELISRNAFVQTELEKLLQNVYPNHVWDISKLRYKKGTMKASQRILFTTVKQLFPDSGATF